MDDATATLVAVLIPCLLAILVVATILYLGFYKDWMERCLYSSPRAREEPSEQQQQQQQREKNSTNDRKSIDLEAQNGRGDPSVVFPPARPLWS
ncbi:hypothetical protein J7T55_007165 [Diaporthe amygdali]|uniref:uncharacterized protein n=1 Tax=Phomopsis amygdali TaxID=1214568 RepID=UPI0022FEC5E4|nr:uncharacterized protein J7T55_007165 [Diaporthe amygdali]KAJ0108047.1 hypothetical protein J7T55_007165 [Diaporthe amygdali]